MVIRAWDKYLNIFGNVLICIGSFSVRDPHRFDNRIVDQRAIKNSSIYLALELFDWILECRNSCLVSEVRLNALAKKSSSAQQ